MALSDAQGQILERCDYADFGEPRFFGPSGEARSRSHANNRILYAGRPYDEWTRLYDSRTRWLEPQPQIAQGQAP